MSESAAAAVTVVPAERTLFGIAALLANTVFFALSDTFAKLLNQSLPPIEVAWLRFAAFCLVLLPILVARGFGVVRTRRPDLQIVRGLLSVMSATFFILSLGRLPIAEATAISFAAPIFTVALALVVLGESVGARRWAAAVAGLVGVTVIVQPGTGAFQLATLLPLAAAVAAAAGAIVTRLMRAERAETTLIYSAAIGLAALSAWAAFDWVWPSGWQLAIGGVVGVFGALANLMGIIAYRHARASVLAPFTYAQIIWASGLGYVAFGLLPSAATYVGAAIIAASGLAIAYGEHRRPPAA